MLVIGSVRGSSSFMPPHTSKAPSTLPVTAIAAIRKRERCTPLVSSGGTWRRLALFTFLNSVPNMALQGGLQNFPHQIIKFDTCLACGHRRQTVVRHAWHGIDFN